MHNQRVQTCLCSKFREALNSLLSELLTARWLANVGVPLLLTGVGIYVAYRIFTRQRKQTEADQLASKNQAFASSYAVKARATAAKLDSLYHDSYADDTGANAHLNYSTALRKLCMTANDAGDLFAVQVDKTGPLTDAAKTIPSVYLARLISVRYHNDITNDLSDIQSYVVRQRIHELTGFQVARLLREVALAAEKWDGRGQSEVAGISVLDPPPRKRTETIDEFELVSAQYRQWGGEQADILGNDLDDLRETFGKARLSARPGAR